VLTASGVSIRDASAPWACPASGTRGYGCEVGVAAGAPVAGIGDAGDSVGIGSTGGDGFVTGCCDPPQAPVMTGPTTRMDETTTSKDMRDQFIEAGVFTMRASLETASRACRDLISACGSAPADGPDARMPHRGAFGATCPCIIASWPPRPIR
jgi:hypothetical protein